MENICFPVGRMVGGNLDKLYPVYEQDGKTPKLDKLGKPQEKASFSCAIPKGPEAQMQIQPGQPPAWAHTEWGRIIYTIGATAHPNLVLTPTFAWKIIDGDSPIPNKNGKKPCDQTGYPGHWVIRFSRSWLPKRCNSDGTVELPEGSIVPGYYIRVYGSVEGNKLVPNGTPGVYMNPIAVALVGEGDKIATDVDTSAVFAQAAPLPPGARPVSPVVPGMPPMGVPPVPPLPGMVPPVPPMVTPPVPMTPPAPVAPARVMLPAAGGQTYEQMIAANWTDALLISHGMMQAPAVPGSPLPVPTPPAIGVPPTAPNMAILTPPVQGVAPGGIPPVPPAPPAPPVPPAPPAPPVPPAPPAPPAGPVPGTMTEKAQGMTREQFAGWTDQQLREQGYMY